MKIEKNTKDLDRTFRKKDTKIANLWEVFNIIDA